MTVSRHLILFTTIVGIVSGLATRSLSSASTGLYELAKVSQEKLEDYAAENAQKKYSELISGIPISAKITNPEYDDLYSDKLMQYRHSFSVLYRGKSLTTNSFANRVDRLNKSVFEKMRRHLVLRDMDFPVPAVPVSFGGLRDIRNSISAIKQLRSKMSSRLLKGEIEPINQSESTIPGLFNQVGARPPISPIYTSFVLEAYLYFLAQVQFLVTERISKTQIAIQEGDVSWSKWIQNSFRGRLNLKNELSTLRSLDRWTHEETDFACKKIRTFKSSIMRDMFVEQETARIFFDHVDSSSQIVNQGASIDEVRKQVDSNIHVGGLANRRPPYFVAGEVYCWEYWL
ncbi:MAG: hypothetical protein COT74_00800 [Bdellovibrionales bacterium CG10_big_fil_rev_8_21_14_0_10_45_34]|nr:MAG: hypothetical protein COT74_00800 [Bdellovibrionales bacterium CG10_big_fil_rev_8_21_14_0_10_45_34]